MTVKLDRNLTAFVSPEILFNFPSLFPGQAEDSMTPGSKSYKIEGGVTDAALQAEPAMLQAMSYVAQMCVPDVAGRPPGEAWQRAVWNKLPYLHETKRDASKYEYYAGMRIVNFSMVLSLNSLKLKDCNLAIPEHRMRYDEAIAAKAPGAVKFCNPNLPADLAKIEQMNRERMAQGLTLIPESEYHTKTIPLAAHEIWSGCKGRIFGRVYWGQNQKPQALGLAFDQVLLTDDTGPRLSGSAISADAAFSNFAPAASLAPQAPLQFPGMPQQAPVIQPGIPGLPGMPLQVPAVPQQGYVLQPQQQPMPQFQMPAPPVVYPAAPQKDPWAALG